VQIRNQRQRFCFIGETEQPPRAFAGDLLCDQRIGSRWDLLELRQIPSLGRLEPGALTKRVVITLVQAALDRFGVHANQLDPEISQRGAKCYQPEQILW